MKKEKYELSKLEISLVAKHLNLTRKDNCICGSINYLVKNPVSLNALCIKESSIVPNLGQFYIPISCENCGKTDLYSAKAIGLIP